MDKKFVRVLCDVHCDWEGLPPVYRVYVNDELFTERTWIWNNEYLEELIQINAEPGQYQIRHELVPPHLAQLTVANMRVELGDANIKGENLLRIYNENS
jgi:hypothetical protein